MTIQLQTRQEIFNDGYRQGYMQGLQAGKQNPDLHLQKNRISLKQFAEAIGVAGSVVHNAQKYQKYLFLDNLGNKYTTTEALKQYRIDEAKAKYLLEQIKLFVEWLHDIKHISASEIARQVGVSVQVILKLDFGVGIAIKIGKAFRKELDEFEEFYR